MTESLIADRLAAFDTATLHECGARAMPGSTIRMLSGVGRIAGPVLTVMCPPGDNLMIHVAVAQAAPGTVLVVQCHDPDYGVWGEVLTVAAMARGIAGLVLDGSVRDLGAIRKLGFPVFALGTSLRGTTKVVSGTVGETITCAGVPVWPDSLVVADESGVVILKAYEFEPILARAEQRVQKEEVVMGELRGGRTTVELFGLARNGFPRSDGATSHATGVDRRARITELGLTLHGPHPPHAPLVPAIVYGDIVRISGQLPRIDGQITCLGHLGSTVSVADGVRAAEVCALNALAVLESSLGSLNRVKQILRVTGFVASAPDFTEQHVVVDGASHIFRSVFGEAGQHVRSAIGVAALPRGAAVEIELSAAITS